MQDVDEALQLISEALDTSGHTDLVKIGLDVAASEMVLRDATGVPLHPCRCLPIATLSTYDHYLINL